MGCGSLAAAGPRSADRRYEAPPPAFSPPPPEPAAAVASAVAAAAGAAGRFEASSAALAFINGGTPLPPPKASPLKAAAPTAAAAPAGGHRGARWKEGCELEELDRQPAPTDSEDLAYGPCFGPPALDSATLERRSLPASCYEVLDAVDKTRNSTVYAAEWKATGARVAVKRVDKRSSQQPFRMHANEVRVLARLDHPCLARLIGIVDTASHLDIVLEYCAGGDLHSYMCSGAGQNHDLLPPLRDVARGLVYMHEEWFAHLDVKPGNILLAIASTEEASAAEPCGAKLCDFGTATRLGASRRLRGVVGTPGFRAPEVEEGLEFDGTLADVWSLGKVLAFVEFRLGRRLPAACRAAALTAPAGPPAAMAVARSWAPPPPEVWNPYREEYGELKWFRHGTAFQRRYAPRWPLLSARLNTDSTLLCTASTDKTVRVHEVATGKEVYTFRHPDVVRSARFSPVKPFLCTACEDCFVRVFSLVTGEEVSDVQHGSRATTACFSRDGVFLCTGSKDKTARIFVARLKKKFNPEANGLGSAQPPEGYEESESEADSLADVGPGGVRQSQEPPKPAAPAVDPVDRLIPEYDKGARWGRIGEIKRAGRENWGPPKKEVEPPPIAPIPRRPDDPAIVFSHDSSVLSAAFDHDVTRICTSTGATRFFGAAYVYDIETQAELYKFDTHGDAVTSVELSIDGKLLYTASRDKTARIWSLEDKREVASFLHPNWIHSANPSVDGRWICTACEDGFARVWDTRHLKELVKLQHDGPVTCASFGPSPPDLNPNDPSFRALARERKPPGLAMCTASADGAARLFGAAKN